MTNRTPISGPCAWQGKDIKDSKRWIRELTPAHVAELEGALAALKGKPWEQITRADFPLARLDDLLVDIRDELENGCGIMKLKGFPVENHSEDDLRRMYFGLGTHLGTPVFQNRSGELMRAIREAIDQELTAHQREVLVAIALNDVPIDVLADRLSTTRGALYKTIHDARRKLRRRLDEKGLRI